MLDKLIAILTNQHFESYVGSPVGSLILPLVVGWLVRRVMQKLRSRRFKANNEAFVLQRSASTSSSLTKAVAYVGDATTCGGRIISGSGTMNSMGNAVARVGDFVSCPRHGMNVIVEGSQAFCVDGMSVARHGDLTMCGSRLISSSEYLSIT
jgi:uncharacterized Zn-binding protein involved in type VI secretion